MTYTITKHIKIEHEEDLQKIKSIIEAQP